MSRAIGTILLDWSGTLVDDLRFAHRAANQVLALYRKPTMTLEEFRERFFLPLRDFYRTILPEVPLETLDRFYHAAFRFFRPRIPLLPHAVDFLEFCRAKGLRMILLSTIQKDHFLDQARRHGILGYFSQIHTEVTDKRVALSRLREEMGLAPQEAIFLGDMVHDIEAAHAAGILSGALLTGYDTRAKLEAARPSFLFADLAEARSFLEERRETKGG
ncbi:Phosphoglycolate phosphatase [Methylacidimicrobium sp. AP8]|uniref:HAD family hydrolase n=1 Tax=Methylacidimicrobium sp. AP8 TaxID=2730359 RepID=UPI0018C03FE2|nr:HAD family hydrolase [Methylacidimicrobium sp. AP8]CAB4243666.1 Phosphoglycolate phosphatase [Methylacidimicrobium sp. AP8]